MVKRIRRILLSVILDEINAIIEDAAGDLWIGTFGGGLNKFARETQTFCAHRFSDL